MEANRRHLFRFALLPDMYAPQAKHHILRSLKEAHAFLPAHTAVTVLKPDKLLVHFMPIIWAYFAGFAHSLLIPPYSYQQREYIMLARQKQAQG